MRKLLMMLIVAACSTTTSEPPPDGNLDFDATSFDALDAVNVDGDVDGMPDMPVASDLCDLTGDGTFAAQCCPFEDSCGAGLHCYYDWSNENQTTQEHSQCLPSPSSAPTLGEECPANGDCADGLFCDRVMSGEIGHCRKLCDAANPCSSGTCHGIPVCAQGMCIEAQGELGYCAP